MKLSRHADRFAHGPDLKKVLVKEHNYNDLTSAKINQAKFYVYKCPERASEWTWYGACLHTACPFLVGLMLDITIPSVAGWQRVL